MPDEIIRTVADELVELVKKSKRISVDEAAKKLSLSLPSVQALVDFLVEEKIFGIEYKFTTPYVYLYKDQLRAKRTKDAGLTSGLVTKEQFFERAKEKKIPNEQIEGLWRKYLKRNFAAIRGEFLSKAQERKMSNDKIEELWEKYLTYL